MHLLIFLYKHNTKNQKGVVMQDFLPYIIFVLCILFIVLVSIQFTLNRIFATLKDIKFILISTKNKPPM